ncbi:peptide-N-glycosidase F-related protein [Aureispira sp. CCB-QB1]|uniref:T9SS type A sorting domain-containing protein n=1 Tax=Aureispira sp. CCB-QB1 TaxID=1313421 RepID=UPI0009DE413F|nr:peptide-N-glycosidase F-related protein [Aureispira sp. CCB-QB1]
MRLYTTLLLSMLYCSISSYAAPGDTTTVLVHNAVDMTWFGNYDQQGVFPDGSTTYRKVIMTYTLGCASGGCSDWDYTTQIWFRRPTGTLDSTVTNLDTVSTNPLVVDTTWNVYEVIENMELGRVITPYGTYMDNGSNGFNNSWSHRYTFDVTDYVHLLKDTCDIRAHYSGWSSGFSVTLRFDFIEGTPPRDILSIHNLYKGSKGYSTFNDFESTYFTPKTVNVPANATGARIFSTITGHGFDNNVNCAEFCPRQYTVKTNGAPLNSAMIWKDDCGSNPIYPQGGTWIYDRAGWCPGSKGDIHEFEWTNFNAGAANTIDFDMQSYTWSGNQAPSYTVNAHVVFYGNNNYTNDASLIDIIAPSKHEEHLRKNPFCGNPVVKVKNLGAAPITTLVIEYGLNGAGTCRYTWTGNLPFLEETNIELPTLQWQGANPNDPTFTATIVSVNGVADEFPQDNTLKSTYDVPDIHTLPFLLLSVQTNNYANETSYAVKDKDGNIIFERIQGSMAPNTVYKDSIFLSDGCYNLTVNDGGGDGLGWWANTAQGSGHVRILSPIFTFITLKNFAIDFGNSIDYNFVWTSTDSIQSACSLITGKEVIPTLTELTHALYPNPTTGVCTVEIGSPEAQDYTCRVYNMMGGLVHQQRVQNTTHSTLELNLEDQPSGVYLFEVEGSLGTKRVEKFIIAK